MRKIEPTDVAIASRMSLCGRLYLRNVTLVRAWGRVGCDKRSVDRV